MIVIAEIGINHNGNLSLARKMIDAAKDCGCDAVKFQKRTIDVVYKQEFLALPRNDGNPFGWKTQGDQKRGLEFGRDEYDAIDDYCKKVGIDWFASAWDVVSQRFLQRYNLPYNKVASAMLAYEPLLDVIAEERKPTFISTGMALINLSDVDEVLRIFKRERCDVILMHCTSLYPCPDVATNISRISALKSRFPSIPIGYSGHETGLLPTLCAMTLGVAAVERHFTLDRSLYGSDQAASVEPQGMRKIVEYSRIIDSIMNSSGYKLELSDKEKEIREKLRWFL